jgi:hypothetical protein
MRKHCSTTCYRFPSFFLARASRSPHHPNTSICSIPVGCKVIIHANLEAAYFVSGQSLTPESWVVVVGIRYSIGYLLILSADFRRAADSRVNYWIHPNDC